MPKHYDGPADTLDLMMGRGVVATREFCIGNAMKYLHRLCRKDDPLLDAKKALYYAELTCALTWLWEGHGAENAKGRPLKCSELLAMWRKSRDSGE